MDYKLKLQSQLAAKLALKFLVTLSHYMMPGPYFYKELRLFFLLLSGISKLAFRERRAFPSCYQIRKKITDHLDINFSLAQLSREAGINSSVLNEEFCQVFGLSVHEFGIREKMERARQLLAQSDQMVYEISESVGYKNATHFSAAFKRKFGKTPRQYRNSL